MYLVDISIDYVNRYIVISNMELMHIVTICCFFSLILELATLIMCVCVCECVGAVGGGVVLNVSFWCSGFPHEYLIYLVSTY